MTLVRVSAPFSWQCLHCGCFKPDCGFYVWRMDKPLPRETQFIVCPSCARTERLSMWELIKEKAEVA